MEEREDRGLDQNDSSVICSDSGHVLTFQQSEFTNERRRKEQREKEGVKDKSKVFFGTNWKNGVAIY